jgi:putative ABC transport system permease protein
LLNSLRHEVAVIDKELPVADSMTLRDRMDFWYTEPRFVLTMMGAFAALGLALVSIGVYSVLSYTVSQRTHEFGVRMALGAEATDVRQMVLKAGLKWLAVGIGIGVPASIALARILQNRIWGIKSADPLTLVAVSLLLTVVGLLACYIPARRATKVDPMVALRYE